MNNKGLIAALIIIIALGGIIYFSVSKNKNSNELTGVTITEEALTPSSSSQVPTNTASNNEIIDFMVDGLTSDETNAAKATIDSTVPSTQSEAGASLKTDF